MPRHYGEVRMKAGKAGGVVTVEVERPDVTDLIASGQPNTVSVRFRPKISAETCFGFGLSAFSSFGDSAETSFSAERGCFGQNNCFGQQRMFG